MSRLDEVLRALVESEPDNYWNDIGSGEVAEMLAALAPTEWAQLNEMLPALPEDQLQRLAYAVGSVSSPHARELLVRLIAFGREALALGACDSLRAELEVSRVRLTVSAQLFDYIALLRTRCQEPWKASCERLLRYLRV